MENESEIGFEGNLSVLPKTEIYVNTEEALIGQLAEKMTFNFDTMFSNGKDESSYGDIERWLGAISFVDGKTPDIAANISSDQGQNIVRFETSSVEPVSDLETNAKKEDLIYSLALTEAKLKHLDGVSIEYIDGDTNEKGETSAIGIIEEVFPNKGEEIKAYHEEIQKITKAVLADKRKEFSLASSMANIRFKVTSVVVLASMILAACTAASGIMAAPAQAFSNESMPPVVHSENVEAIQNVSSIEPALQVEIEPQFKAAVVEQQFKAAVVETPKIDWMSLDAIPADESKEEVKVLLEEYLSLENTEKMGKYLSEISPELKSYYELSHAINSYDSKTMVSMEDHIAQSEWYKNEKLRFKGKADLLANLDAGVRQFSQVADNYGSAQCVGGDMLFSAISEGEIKNPTTRAEDPSLSLGKAKELVPDEVKYQGYTSYYDNGYLAKRVSSLADLEDEELFATWDTEVGHTGAVVHTDVDENGVMRKWIVDVNRLNDGKMRIYYVTEDTYRIVLGNSIASVK